MTEKKLSGTWLLETKVGLLILLIVIIGMVTSLNLVKDSLPGSDKAQECGMSKYNTFSNSTQGYSYSFGNCYVQMFESYQDDIECRGGLLGIGQSCIEKDNWKSYRYTLCFKLKTGERC